MKPLICFYKNDQFFYAQDYLRLQCADDILVVDFLKDIEQRYFSEVKIVQINFEGDQQSFFADQNKLYPSAKASVFILKKFSLLSWSQILPKLEVQELKKIANFKPRVQKKEFIKKTNYVIDQIKAGRVYQANLTAALSSTTNEDSLNLYAHFQKLFQGQYKAFLPLENVNVLCFSPELFLHQENKTLTTKPIKGSLDHEKDFSNDLLKSAKEEAELSMIVDLLRNDLNSISPTHSAQVISHRQKMQLGYIQHTFSEIAVHSESPLSHVIEKTFPGGSISGCPKIESLQVIREVETDKRQIYTGSIGWWKLNDFCLNITIRSMIHHEKSIFYHAGCGIVYDSQPESEWNEFLIKTGSLNVR